MTKFRSKYRIEPNRWIYWDYFAPGKYFLTICINKRECILGKVVSKKMELSEFGEFVETEIRKIPEYNPRIILDEWQVMPNHIHPNSPSFECNRNEGVNPLFWIWNCRNLANLLKPKFEKYPNTTHALSWMNGR